MSSNNKQISSLSAMALGATAMVGSGWLFSAQLNARLAGNYAFVSWICAALIVTLIAICLSRVIAVYPVRGATSMCSTLSHNHVFGMPFAFANWFAVMISIANEAQATTEYLSSAIKHSTLVENGAMTLNGKLFALMILFVYLAINFYGVKLLARVNNVVTVFKVFIPLFTIIVFLIAKFDTSNFTLATNSMYNGNSVIGAIIGAGLIYSFNGFQIPASFASEIKNAGKGVLFSMVGGIFIILCVYLLLQLAFMGAVPHDLVVSKGGWSGMNLQSPLMNLAVLLGLNFVMMLLVA
ncbi:MAG: APC family permease, partial [Burkholderiales bacterium]|nr:APC family permease [Burkholderiales bacterium]